MISDAEKNEMEKAELKRELVLDDLVFQPGAKVDVIRVTARVYKVFVQNGWWAVSADYFVEEGRSADVDDLTPVDDLKAMGMV